MAIKYLSKKEKDFFKKRHQANVKKKKVGIGIIPSYKTEFKLKRMKAAKEGYFIVRKDPFYHEKITHRNLYAYTDTAWKKYKANNN